MAGPVASAAPPAPVAVDVYGRLPNIELMQMAPSGRRFAYVSVSGDHRQLVVRDIDLNILFNAPLADNKVSAIDWAGDEHLLITVRATEEIYARNYEMRHSVVVNLTTRKSFTVFDHADAITGATYGYYGSASKAGRLYGYFGGQPLYTARGFSPSLGDDSYVNLYGVDLDSGVADIAASGAHRPHDWALAADGTVVSHSEYDPATGDWYLYAAGTEASVIETLHDPLGEIGLAGLGRTPGAVLIEKSEPEEVNLADASRAPLATERPVAASNYLFDPTTHRLVGAVLTGDRADQQFFDPVLKARQGALRKALGGAPQIVSWSADSKALILYTEGDGDAGTYWLVNGAKVSPYGYSYPDLPDANVGSSRMITYKAADGLEIHGVLTLPPGRDPRGLPLVVLPHGGPQAHDSLRFDWFAQAFAGRGYAVFQPNFRGSDGYGVEFRDAGFGQWGRKMQTDISDGVAALARDGLVDPKRACIVGASYGGYAALAGVTVQHGLYRCAVSHAGISDLNYFLFTVTPGDADERNPATRYIRKFLGARSENDSAMSELSPAKLAARADAPILLIHGADDTVVPVGQSREMERNLTAAGKPVEFVLLKGEDHWLSRDATRKAMLNAAVAFVEKHNPAD